MICHSEPQEHSADSPEISAPVQWTLPKPQLQHSRDQVLLRGLHVVELGRLTDGRDLLLESGPEGGTHALVSCTHGTVRVDAADATFDLAPGEAAMLPADTPFRVVNPATQPAQLQWVRFAGEDSDYYVRTLGHGLSRFTLSPASRTRVGDVFAQLGTVLRDDAGEWNLIHAAHLARLLMSHLLGQETVHYQPCDEPLHPGIEAAVQYMQHNLDLTISLKDVARQAGLSVSHFCALFRSQMGVTPMEYLTKLKLRKARRLLVSTALTVQEVALQVGYEDRYYFSRLFRKLNGVPPVTYRRRQREQAHAAAC